jgi:hypothetical protein
MQRIPVHALPDLRIAGGRFGGRFLAQISLSSEPALSDHSEQNLTGWQRWRATAKSQKLKAVSRS